jgi:hypothetical protein
VEKRGTLEVTLTARLVQETFGLGPLSRSKRRPRAGEKGNPRKAKGVGEESPSLGIAKDPRRKLRMKRSRANSLILAMAIASGEIIAVIVMMGRKEEKESLP